MRSQKARHCQNGDSRLGGGFIIEDRLVGLDPEARNRIEKLVPRKNALLRSWWARWFVRPLVVALSKFGHMRSFSRGFLVFVSFGWYRNDRSADMLPSLPLRATSELISRPLHFAPFPRTLEPAHHRSCAPLHRGKAIITPRSKKRAKIVLSPRLQLIMFTFGLLTAISAVLFSGTAVPSVTNAQLLARGLGPKRLTRLFQPTPVSGECAATFLSHQFLCAGSQRIRAVIPQSSAEAIPQNIRSLFQRRQLFYLKYRPMELSFAQDTRVMCPYDDLGSQPPILGPESSTSLLSKTCSSASHTPAGSRPTADSSVSYHYVETTVYTVSSTTGEVHIRWVNPDGTTPPIFSMI
ncbi:hypothetical protein K438DRAFT_1758180 [Mycena galopus ATCC 62051]|nr:hypothetical protein K438DRAFT_1758180 [Mycena galopus ATCC 62051]